MKKATIVVVVPRGDRYIDPNECRAVIEIEGEAPREAPRLSAFGKKDYMEVKTLCAALKAVGEPCAVVVATHSRRLASRVDLAGQKNCGGSPYAREIAKTAREEGHALLPSSYAPYGWAFMEQAYA